MDAQLASFGVFRLFPVERQLKKGAKLVRLNRRALDTLVVLVERAGEVVTQRELMSRVWPSVTVDEANLRVQIARLRRALGDGRRGARYIVTVPGRGYCFIAPVTISEPEPTPSKEGVSAQLPKLSPRLTRMIGRDDIVRDLSYRLIRSRFVSIVGPGGVGKTTVANAIAHGFLDDFNGWVVFVDLTTLTDADLVPATVASALGLMLQTEDKLLDLVKFIGDRKLLLVLDNCEHVVEVAAALAERIVREASHAHVLATSREALGAEGEHVHMLHALDCPPEGIDLTAAEALKYPAAQLFMERAAAGGYRAELTDADASTVAKICQRLDGIALAIELAASRVGLYGIRETERLLDDCFKLVWQGRRTSLPRHQTLSAMLDWSYNLLSEQEKAVLRRLSVFRGEFGLQLAGSVASDAGPSDGVIGAIESLIAKSLISTKVSDGPTLFRLLDTTQAYAAEKLVKSGEADHIARRLAASYLELLKRNEVMQSTVRARNHTAYAPHIGNIRVALSWALSDQGDREVGIELAGLAAPLFVEMSLLEEYRTWCERALAALTDMKRGSEQEMILLEALAISSMFSKGRGDRVRYALERALELAESFKDGERQLRLLADLNLYLVRLGDFPAATVAMQRAAAIAQSTKNPGGVITVEWMAGVGCHVQGDQTAAQLHFERVMALQVELGTLGAKFLGGGQRVGYLCGLALVLWLRGFFQQARTMAQSAIDAAASQDYAVSMCISLVHAATIDLCTGEFARADALIEQLITLAARYSLAQYHGDGLAMRGELAIAQDGAGADIESVRNALAMLRSEGYNLNVTRYIGVLAAGLHKRGELEEALLTIDGGVSLANASGVKFYLAELLHIKARILASMSQSGSAEAMSCLERSLTIAREQGALALELRSACTLAGWLRDRGQRKKARRVVSSVCDRFTEGFDTADVAAARQLIEELA